MKVYDVDVHALSPEGKRKVEEQLEQMAFMVSETFSASEGVVALQVYWDSKEDFFSSHVFPSNCPCKEVHFLF